ncbi:MAG: hypothetical protein ACI8TX_003103 [Hyphomicrobiaceae bacterium]|jgi:hypothetical protein
MQNAQIAGQLRLAVISVSADVVAAGTDDRACRRLADVAPVGDSVLALRLALRLPVWPASAKVPDG